MIRMTAEAKLKDALTRNGEQVELCDEAGDVIGYAATAAEMRRVEIARRSAAYAQADATFNAEEHRKTLDDPRKYTTEELFQKLGLQ